MSGATIEDARQRFGAADLALAADPVPCEIRAASPPLRRRTASSSSAPTPTCPTGGQIGHDIDALTAYSASNCVQD
jgi:hypothetical protein